MNSLQVPTVSFYTMGCKLNFAETATISEQLLGAGYQKVDFEQGADICIINTCSVTEKADKECKYIINKSLRYNPDAKVIVTGCFAQLKPETIAQYPGVYLVLGAKEKFNFLQFIENEGVTDTVHACEIEDVNQFHSSYSVNERTRAFLKVQDGCDYKCTYCTIPLARGISRSDNLENILSQAKNIANQGIKEIVLTGVNIGDYGKGEFGNKKHQHTFLELIQALDQIQDIDRLRISSIEPNLLNDDCIAFIAQSTKFVPHFHIPLQSGSDVVLKKMQRRYLTALYQNRVETIKEAMPHACIGVDVIVGFPGETEEEFLKTYNFINSLDISYLHVFTYSERLNTKAVEMEGIVPMEERKNRNKMLRILSEKKRFQFYQSQQNTIRTVLWEDAEKNGNMFGYTENYIKIQAPFDAHKGNTLEQVVLEKMDKSGNYVYSPAMTFS